MEVPIEELLLLLLEPLPVMLPPLMLLPLIPPPHAASINTAQADSPVSECRVDLNPSMV
jgi:hypothetical protein